MAMLVSIFTLPQEVLSFGKPMLFDGTDFVKSSEKRTTNHYVTNSNVDLTTSLHYVQIFTFLMTAGSSATNDQKDLH